MKRLFIAADIPDSARETVDVHIDRLRKRFRDVRVSWVRPENLHITLKFLGDLDEGRIELISSSLRRAATNVSRFEATLTRPVAFGRRALVVEIADVSGSFVELNTMIEKECQSLGLERENRPFRPHLTIGRLRDAKGTANLIAAHRNSVIEPVCFRIDSVVLYESRLQPTGSIYMKMDSFVLR